MSTVMEGSAVTRRNDVTVKMDPEVVRVCKIAAQFKGMSLAQYLSESMHPIALADIDRGSKAESKKGKGGPA